MIGETTVKRGIEVEYDAVIVHYTDDREPRVVDCVTDFAKSRHLRTGEEALQILHQSCEGEGRNTGTLVFKPLDVPLSEIDHLVVHDGQGKTVVEPTELC